jgi:thioredoxin 1
MKKVIKLSSVVLFAISLGLIVVSCSKYKPVLSSQQGINFKVTTLAAAKEMAKDQNKPLFVFAHASWCPTCKKMEQEVLVKKELGNEFNQGIINVAIDIDGPDGQKLKELYPIRATPTLFFFNPDGTISKKIEGFTTADDLLAEGKVLKN